MPKFMDLTGMVFGRLTVLEQSHKKGRKLYWHCKCECGNFKTASGADMRDGHTKSCGCLQKEVAGARFRSHGFSGTKEYETWKGMKARCFNKKSLDYHKYGGRGITMADEWKDNFEAFYSHVGPAPEGDERYSIDRLDPNGHYEPGNVRWATDAQQARNQGIRTDNKTGYTGVYESEKYFVATWYDLDGTSRQRYFSKKTHGSELAEFIAAEFRDKKMWELNKLGAGYTPHHGK